MMLLLVRMLSSSMIPDKTHKGCNQKDEYGIATEVQLLATPCWIPGGDCLERNLSVRLLG